MGNWASGMGHGALGMGHGALGMGHGALGMGHWAWGMGHGALGIGHRLTVNRQPSTVNSPKLPHSGDSTAGSSIAPKPPKLKTSNGGFDRTQT